MPKFIIRETSQEALLTVMRNAQKQISEDQIDVFLYYDTETALQIVHDVVDEAGGKQNPIDREVKDLALRIKRNKHYAAYKAAADKYMNFK